MRSMLLLAFLLLSLPACASSPRVATHSWPGVDVRPAVQESVAVEGEEKVSATKVALLWLPNRILDLFDIAKAGVNVGPGLGINAKATDAVQGTFLNRTSVGVGLQTLRRVPVYAGGESAVGAGPLAADVVAGLGWGHSSTDIRLELHPVIAGAHVAIDPWEIADFILGIATVDISDDDY